MNWMDEIRSYVPWNEQEKTDKNMFLHCMNVFDNLLNRSSIVAHITSSAFLIDKSKDKTLMVYHNIYNSWSWTGGHADGDGDLLAVAVREAQEETGVKNIHPVYKDVFSLDVLPVLGHIKRGTYIPAHIHLSVAYLCEADERETLKCKPDENSSVSWIPFDKVAEWSSEPHMVKVYEKLIYKVRDLGL